MLYIAKKKNKNGVTLIELLVSTIVLAFIAFAIYTTLNSGIRIWQRVNWQRTDEDMNIFFEKLASDLHNALRFNGIGFFGRKDGFELPTLVTSDKLDAITAGKVKYIYDKSNKAAKRSLADFSDLYSSEEGVAREVVKDLKELKFTYYIYDDAVKEYFWQDEWTTGELPLAVRVEAETECEGRTGHFVKTISIPVSN